MNVPIVNTEFKLEKATNEVSDCIKELISEGIITQEMIDKTPTLKYIQVVRLRSGVTGKPAAYFKRIRLSEAPLAICGAVVIDEEFLDKYGEDEQTLKSTLKEELIHWVHLCNNRGIIGDEQGESEFLAEIEKLRKPFELEHEDFEESEQIDLRKLLYEGRGFSELVYYNTDVVTSTKKRVVDRATEVGIQLDNIKPSSSQELLEVFNRFANWHRFDEGGDGSKLMKLMQLLKAKFPRINIDECKTLIRDIESRVGKSNYADLLDYLADCGVDTFNTLDAFYGRARDIAGSMTDQDKLRLLVKIITTTSSKYALIPVLNALDFPELRRIQSNSQLIGDLQTEELRKAILERVDADGQPYRSITPDGLPINLLAGNLISTVLITDLQLDGYVAVAQYKNRILRSITIPDLPQGVSVNEVLEKHPQYAAQVEQEVINQLRTGDLMIEDHFLSEDENNDEISESGGTIIDIESRNNFAIATRTLAGESVDRSEVKFIEAVLSSISYPALGVEVTNLDDGISLITGAIRREMGEQIAREIIARRHEVNSALVEPIAKVISNPNEKDLSRLVPKTWYAQPYGRVLDESNFRLTYWFEKLRDFVDKLKQDTANGTSVLMTFFKASSLTQQIEFVFNYLGITENPEEMFRPEVDKT